MDPALDGVDDITDARHVERDGFRVWGVSRDQSPRNEADITGGVLRRQQGLEELVPYQGILIPGFIVRTPVPLRSLNTCF